MSWTQAENDRVEAIERMLNKIQDIINKLASQKQVRALSVLKQQEIITLQSQVNALQLQVTTLQKNSI